VVCFLIWIKEYYFFFAYLQYVKYRHWTEEENVQLKKTVEDRIPGDVTQGNGCQLTQTLS